MKVKCVVNLCYLTMQRLRRGGEGVEKERRNVHFHGELFTYREMKHHDTKREGLTFCIRECLHRFVPFTLEQSKVVFVLKTVTEGVTLAQVSLIGKAKLE